MTFRKPFLFHATIVASLALLFALTPSATSAATTTMGPACSGVNVRTGPSTSASVKKSLGTHASLTIVGQVSGGRWHTVCPIAKTGSSWYQISAINGKTVRSLYGVASLYAASGVLKSIPAVATGADDPLGGELIRLINLDRVALGKPAYLIDRRLSDIARDAAFACPTNPKVQLRGRARDMADRGYFRHAVPGCYISGTTVYTSLAIVRSVFGYRQARSEILHWNSYGTAPTSYRLGCNIHASACRGGTTTAPYTVTLAQRNFMSSAPHRSAELNVYQRMGCGAATVPGTHKTYFACLFADAGPVNPTPTPAPPASPAPPAATTTMVPACSGVNVRAGASTGATIKTSLGANARLTIVGKVAGGSWHTVCPTSKSGSTWYRISAINGKSVSSLYGVSILYAAGGVLK